MVLSCYPVGILILSLCTMIVLISYPDGTLVLPCWYFHRILMYHDGAHKGTPESIPCYRLMFLFSLTPNSL